MGSLFSLGVAVAISCWGVTKVKNASLEIDYFRLARQRIYYLINNPQRTDFLLPAQSGARIGLNIQYFLSFLTDESLIPVTSANRSELLTSSNAGFVASIS